MALSINKTKKIYGKEITFENAYCKISCFSGDKSFINFELICYNNNLDMIEMERSNFNMQPALESENNFIKQGYEYLKTLDEYKDAIDC